MSTPTGSPPSISDVPGEVVDIVAGPDNDAWRCTVDRLGETTPADRPAVRLRVDDRELQTLRSRAADLIAIGYSIRCSGEGTAELEPTPSGALYIAPWMVIGGTDKGTIDWFRYITKDQFRRYLVTTAESDNPTFPDCAALADEAWCLPELLGRDAIPEFLIEFIATRGVDVVHIMNARLGFDMIPAIKLAFPDVQIVVQLHAEEFDRAGYPRYVASRYDNLVDAYSVISEDMARRVEDYWVSPSKLEVIYLGVEATGEFDPERSDGQPIELESGRFHVLFPARLVSVKRPEMVLGIADALRSSAPEAMFHIVGDGELRADLEAECARRHLGGQVQFHGASRNMWGWFKTCDAVLLTSLSEGAPLVGFEAMSMGTPLVAPDVGAVAELLGDGSGLLMPESAGVSDYAAAIELLLRDPAARHRMGASARARVLERFKVETMADRHRSLYARLIAARRVDGR